MKCSAIIVTYNGMQFYDAYFRCLLASTIRLEIICVDNNSSDESRNYIKNKFPEIQLIENGMNVGFALANNFALKLAYNNGSDFFFLLNQDAWVENDTVEKLINFLIKHPEYGIASPIHLNADKSHFDKSFLGYFYSSKTIHAYENLKLEKNEPACYDTNFFNAAAWLITRKCLEVVGGFDTILFKHYGEDNNYCDRAKYHNFKIAIVPSASICHDREHRSIIPGAITFSNDVPFCIRYANILTPWKCYIRHIFGLLIKCNIFQFLRNLIFIIKNYKKIFVSRRRNKKYGYKFIMRYTEIREKYL